MYAESLTGAVDIRDEDDDQPGSVGDYMFTPMYTYVYDYRYRCPPAYSEVCRVYLLVIVLPCSRVLCIARGVQKVRSLMWLITRYVHHILSLFNIVFCN